MVPLRTSVTHIHERHKGGFMNGATRAERGPRDVTTVQMLLNYGSVMGVWVNSSTMRYGSSNKFRTTTCTRIEVLEGY